LKLSQGSVCFVLLWKTASEGISSDAVFLSGAGLFLQIGISVLFVMIFLFLMLIFVNVLHKS